MGEIFVHLATVLVALIVSVISPAVLSLITNRQRRLEKTEDYKRQDEVAARVKKVAENISYVADATSAKLEQIHVLGNSTVTSMMQTELAGLRRELTFLKTIKGINASTKRKVDPGIEATLKATEIRVVDLTKSLTDREKQTEIANAKL